MKKLAVKVSVTEKWKKVKCNFLKKFLSSPKVSELQPNFLPKSFLDERHFKRFWSGNFCLKFTKRLPYGRRRVARRYKSMCAAKPWSRRIEWWEKTRMTNECETSNDIFKRDSLDNFGIVAFSKIARTPARIVLLSSICALCKNRKFFENLRTVTLLCLAEARLPLILFPAFWSTGKVEVYLLFLNSEISVKSRKSRSF